MGSVNEAKTAEQEHGRGARRTCKVADRCGGCNGACQPYDEQLATKNDTMRSLLEDAGFEASRVLHPIRGMDDPFCYRNKVTSPFVRGKRLPDARSHGASGRAGKASRSEKGGRRAGGKRGSSYDILTGMYAAGTHKVIPTKECLIEDERAQQVIASIRSLMLRYGIEPYAEDSGTGFMRHAVVRVGHHSGEVLVTLVTNSDSFPSSKQFCRQLVQRCPFITSVVQNVNLRQTNVILGDRERRLYGPGFILDTLCGLSFRISSHSFYQVNVKQTEVLYRTAIEFAQLQEGDFAVDAYCGTGTIGLVAAKSCNCSVVGVDNVASAIHDARENAQHNGIENARFIVGDAGAIMTQLAGGAIETSSGAPDVLFMDPPRAGSSPEFLDAALSSGVGRIVYISCNPRTQIRDAQHLVRGGYRLETVQPVDMFPHTEHVETVALFSR